MNKLIAFAGIIVIAATSFAADTYYWHDQGDHDLANKANWTKNNQTTVPDTFPPALDTATSGSTHPVINFYTGGTLSLPNDTELTLQDMDFTTANTDWTIDLGSKSKTIKLFGDCNAALWVGGNTPDGQRITLKRGTLARYQSTQRHASIRFGANSYLKRLSYFRVDGPDALIDRLMVDIQCQNCEFCVTNGGTVVISGGYGCRMNPSLSRTARYIVSGEGSLLQASKGVECFFFGDGASSVNKPSGGLEITDGGAVAGARGVIGNRAGNFYVLMDNGSWTNAEQIVLSANGEGTSTNNLFTAQNKSTISLSGKFSVGSCGGYDSALVTNCTLFQAASIYLGEYPYGTKSSMYGHNKMSLVDTPFKVSNVVVGGASNNDGYPNNGPNACNNALEIRNCEFTGTYFDLHLGQYRGGTNYAVLADSTYPMGSVSLGQYGVGSGCNTLFVTNAVVKGNFLVGGKEDSTGYGTSGNTVRFVDSSVGMGPGYTAAFSVGGCGPNATACSNVVELVHSSWTNTSTFFAIGGWNGNQRGNDYNAMVLDDRSYVVSTNGGGGVRVGGHGFHNRLEVKNGATFHANSLMLGKTASNYASTGTNVLYVGKDALVLSESYVQPCPGGNVVIVEDGTLKANYLRLHYYYSAAAKITKDSLTGAETEYGKDGKEIWGSRFIFRGTKPVMRFPANDATSGAISGCQFDRSTYVEFEFPATPYEHGVLQSAYKVGFSAGTNYRFDCSKITHTPAWQAYPLAEVETTGAIEFGTGELANMTAALQEAAAKAGLRAKLAKSSDGKKLIASFKDIGGTLLIVR